MHSHLAGAATQWVIQPQAALARTGSAAGCAHRWIRSAKTQTRLDNAHRTPLSSISFMSCWPRSA